MTLGRAPEQGELGPSSATYCDGMLSPTSIYGLLYRECHQLFPDGAFADLFADIGRSSVPPRMLDSTPLYDAVATQDTVTMIRSAIRGLLRVADEQRATELRGVLKRDDDYAAAGKPA